MHDMRNRFSVNEAYAEQEAPIVDALIYLEEL